MCLTLVQAREIYVDFSVETAGTEQGAVEHVYTVGGGQDDDTAVGAESVHLGEEGVQRVLALIVAAHGWVLASGTTTASISSMKMMLGDFLLSLTEEVADA